MDGGAALEAPGRRNAPGAAEIIAIGHAVIMYYMNPVHRNAIVAAVADASFVLVRPRAIKGCGSRNNRSYNRTSHSWACAAESQWITRCVLILLIDHERPKG